MFITCVCSVPSAKSTIQRGSLLCVWTCQPHGSSKQGGVQMLRAPFLCRPILWCSVPRSQDFKALEVGACLVQQMSWAFRHLLFPS